MNGNLSHDQHMTDSSSPSKSRPAELAGSHQLQQSLPGSAGFSLSRDSTSQFCICPPDQKIPRPRNAFMLYRQHFQASVVAQNPGLANPEISKIIGRQWKTEPQEVRDSWDALAEEEKARHQQQYPNYKYQPRRKGKRPAALDSSALNGAGAELWCGKCGRRSITTPSTPGTPFTPRAAPPMLPPLAAATGSPAPYSRDGYQIPPLAKKAPMAAPPDFRRRPSGPGIDMLQLRDSLNDDVMSPQTPSNKRRRLSPQGWTNASSTQPLRRPSIQGRMDPPPRPNGMVKSPDSSLTLPPLQIQGRSVEAMVMSISALNKIKVLAKISPPLAVPGPTSPTYQIRGAVVAVEGEDHDSILQVTRWLAEELNRDEKLCIRIFDANSDRDVPMSDGGAAAERDTNGGTGFQNYHETIIGWHKRSQELIQFITTVPTHYSGGPQSLVETSGAIPSVVASTGNRRTPVALIPAYMLTHSNQAAIRIPINDAYAPDAHWQWAATLWRGIVGPDLTIWIKRCGREEINRCGGVEVREDARAVIVRNEEGKGGMDARAQRRLAFEVGESIRTISRADGENHNRMEQ